MESNTLQYSGNKGIQLLLVDDSDSFRKFITGMLADSGVVTLIGEAVNGVEALEQVKDSRPDVVLLDLEMPGMDGMVTLQKLREVSSSQVIMVSSLSSEGSARAFDCLKHGAVDFIGKDALHSHSNLDHSKKELLHRILRASRVESMGWSQKEALPQIESTDTVQKRIIFCEECGTRNVVEPTAEDGSEELRCAMCGDPLEAVVITTYRRVSAIGVIGAGRGGAVNLLNIVPHLPKGSKTTSVVVLEESPEYVDSFTRYLNEVSNIKVLRLEDGMNIEGGNCYIASSSDHFSLMAHSTNYTVRRTGPVSGRGSLDLMLESISAIIKNRMFALVLSGHQLDGEKGMELARQNQAYGAVLKATNCLCKELGENILRKSAVDGIVDETGCLELLMSYSDSQSQKNK